MKIASQKHIMYDSPEAARYLTNIKGWVDINNRYYGDSAAAERLARYSSCTHVKCECGSVMQKGYMYCEECRKKRNIERYNKFPFEEYKGQPVYSDLADKYFHDSDEIDEYCEDEGIAPEELRLQICRPLYYQEVQADYWEEGIPEDGDIDSALEKALEELNKVIRTLPPVSYMPADIRTIYKPNLS